MIETQGERVTETQIKRETQRHRDSGRQTQRYKDTLKYSKRQTHRQPVR